MHSNELYKLYKQYPIISTDTRKISPDSIFFALKGEKFNANEFADSALEKGAKAVVIDQKSYAKDERYILVDDVLKALQELANYHRKQLNIPIIAITGTNGKTTTKELLKSVLAVKYNTFATQGNLNNHIGVPLTLLSIDDQVEIAVVEMGANHPKEIEFLCHIAEPTHGLITNVGKAHLEGFGSFEGVKQTKGELYTYLEQHEGVLFLQADNEHLTGMLAGRKMKNTITYGFAADRDIVGELKAANPTLSIVWRRAGADLHNMLETQLTGTYNTENILAAIAVGNYFGLTDEEINTGLRTYQPTNSRSQLIQTTDNLVIADYYNANSSSMLAALDNLSHLQAAHKTAVLGDMFEMGAEAMEEHQRVVERALHLDLDRLILVGKTFFALRDSKAEYYENIDQAKQAIVESKIKGSTVLLKASRGMAFEQLIEHL